jgi:hypothetical protein
MSDALPGILAIFNNAAPGREAEFEEWFQHEHLEERLAVPGFVLGRRYEAVSGQPRYFNFYLTQSADVLKSAVYIERLNHPTPMTHKIMSEIFKDMIRTVCHRTLRLGAMRGAAAVALRFTEKVDHEALKNTAVDARTIPVSEEERLRGGDRKIAACLYIETLRLAEADKIAGALLEKFPAAAAGVYRLLCEIRP